MVNMKKLLSILLSMALIFSLAACGSGTTSSGEGSSSEPSAGSSETSEQPSAELSENPAESEEPVEGENILIAYFSWSGNTERMARMIAEQTGGDLFQIEPATPYTDSGKVILPFYSHCGGVKGNFQKDIARLCPKADVRVALGVMSDGNKNLTAVLQNWLVISGLYVGAYVC